MFGGSKDLAAELTGGDVARQHHILDERHQHLELDVRSGRDFRYPDIHGGPPTENVTSVSLGGRRMLSTAVAVTTLLLGLCRKTGRSDAGKCRRLVIVRGVARDADGTNQLTFSG